MTDPTAPEPLPRDERGPLSQSRLRREAIQAERTPQDDTTEDPFGPVPTGWRAAPDCDRCKDTGRFHETNEAGGTIEAHCGCKQGRRASELWYADKHGLYHPDMPEPSEPDFEEYG